MSDIFDIPETEKIIKKKREMTPEAKQKLLERLKAGRERAKARRAEAVVSERMEPEPEAVVSERMEPEPEPEPDTDYKSSVEEPVNLDNEDVTVLAREIEELESKVNNYQKKERKRKVGGIINNKKKNREDYINNLVEQKINARMNITQATKPAPVQQNKTIRPPTPKPAPIKKVSKFANTIRPIWARGFDI